MSKKIVLTIAGTDISFEPTMTAYNSYINGLSMTDKVAPSHQYLKRIVDADSKEALDSLLARPGAALADRRQGQRAVRP